MIVELQEAEAAILAGEVFGLENLHSCQAYTQARFALTQDERPPVLTCAAALFNLTCKQP